MEKKRERGKCHYFPLLSWLWGASQHFPIFFIFLAATQGKVLRAQAAEVLPSLDKLVKSLNPSLILGPTINSLALKWCIKQYVVESVARQLTHTHTHNDDICLHLFNYILILLYGWQIPQLHMNWIVVVEHNENQPLIGCGEKLGHPTLAAASVVTLTGAGSLLDTVQEALQVIRVMLIKVTGSISHRPMKRDHFKTVLDFGPRSPRSKQTTYCRSQKVTRFESAPVLLFIEILR